MAFRPSTDRNYTSMFRLFLAFTVFMKLSIFNLSPLILIAYIQFLETNHFSPSTMANHMSAIKAKLALFGISTHIFEDQRIKYFHKAMILHQPFKVQLKKIIDIDTLQLIVRTCDSMYMGQVFKAVYTLAYFSFYFFIKWSKTIQTRNVVKILKIPQLGSNPICPVKATKKLMAITPGSNNHPLFQFKSSKGWVPLTDTQVRRNFRIILQKLNLSNSHLTFHAFRRSGATYAFNSNVDLQHIQSHGTWTSECVWKYITLDHQASGQVASTFKKQLYIPTTH